MASCVSERRRNILELGGLTCRSSIWTGPRISSPKRLIVSAAVATYKPNQELKLSDVHEILHPAPENKEVFTAGEQAIECPRCNSTNTKYWYYNYYNRSPPRHFCKSCRRYWIRDVSSRSSSPERVHDPHVILVGINDEEFFENRLLSFIRASVTGGFGGEVAVGTVPKMGTGTGVGIETDPRENPTSGIGNVKAAASGEDPGTILPPKADVHKLSLGGLDAVPAVSGSYIGDAFSSDSVAGPGLETRYYGAGDNPSPKRGQYQQVILAGKNGGEFAGGNDPYEESTRRLCTTGVELKAVRELVKEATPMPETLDTTRTGENLASSDPRPPRVLNTPPSFGRVSVTGGFGGEVADTGENPSSVSPSKDQLFPRSLKMMVSGNKASFSQPVVTGYSNTNYGELVKREKLGHIAQENRDAGTSQTVVGVAETGTNENTAPLTAADNRPPNGNPDEEGIGRPVNGLSNDEEDVSENRNISPSGNPEPNENQNQNQNGGEIIPTVVDTEPSTSKWVEIFLTVGAGGLTTLYAAIDSKRYPTESKVVSVLLATAFICGLIAIVLSNRVANRFLVNLGVLCTYSATIGAMAMLLALNRRWVWGITGVCSLLFLLFLLVVAVLKRERNTAPAAGV